MTIYVDVIFLENLFMNYIIFFASSVILKLPIRLIRFLLASTIGSIYAVIIYTVKVVIFSNVITKIILSILLVYIAFDSKSIKELLKQSTIFYLTSFTFGGVAIALLYFVKPQEIFFRNGVLIGTYPIKIVLAGGIIGFIITTIAFKSIKDRLSKDITCDIKISLNSKETSLKAIIDTGNFLKDPISKLPVVVVEKEALYGIVEKELLDNLEDLILGKDIDLEQYISKIRIIPFTSLGKTNGILMGMKSDSVKISYDNKTVCVENVIIGIYSGKLNRNNRYKALIGLELLEYEGGQKDEYFATIKR